MSTYQCKEPQCPEVVSYEPEVVLGNFVRVAPASRRSRTEIVYLLCPNRHEYPYEVEIEE